jgi:hypothetical protein
MNLTKGKISKLYKKNKQTRKKKTTIHQKKRNHKNVNTFRKKRWFDLSNKTLKKMTGGNEEKTQIETDILDRNAKLSIQNHNQQEGPGAKLEMPEIDIMPIEQNITQEIMDDLSEDMLKDIVSGSIFEPSVDSSPVSINDLVDSVSVPEISETSEIKEVVPEVMQIQEEKEEGLNPNPFDSINNVAHVLASSSTTLPLPLPVYGGKKRRFRLTKKSK